MGVHRDPEGKRGARARSGLAGRGLAYWTDGSGDERSIYLTAGYRMVELDAKYPGYGFARHKGYPVREHYDALDRLGAIAVHRRSFAPVRKALGLDPVQTELFGESIES